MVRRRPADTRDDISLGSLPAGEWKECARMCGRAIGGADLFVDDLLRFADEAAAGVRRDHAYVVADHELGALRRAGVVYR